MKVIEINKKDLIYNINKIKEEMKCQIIAVVKGNGYGLGIVEYTKFLIENGLDYIAVSTVEEAVELRKSGITAKILMLSSTCIKEDVETLIKNNIIITIGSKSAAEVANKLANELKLDSIPVHIKIDTGFGRYGFLYNDIENIVQTINNNNKLKIEGCFSHFSNAYDKKDKWTKLQYEKFLNTIENLKLNKIEPEILHICNSSAALKYPYMRLNAVRIGSAFLGRILVQNSLKLKKIGEFKTKVAEIKILPKGYNIGYSNTFKTKKETKVAILPVGYKDGINMGGKQDSFRFIDYLRFIFNDFKGIFKNKAVRVNINGKSYKALGIIGLYHIVIDIENDDIKVGNIATLQVNPLLTDSRTERRYI